MNLGEPAETPIIEFEKFVKGDNTQDEVVSDIFKLKDKGKRNLALRYEFTFQLKRLAENKKLPYKRFQIGSVFRDEPVKSNRVRQITQCDIDTIGSTIKDEAEILSLVFEVLKELNIKATINVNNRKLLNEIIEKEKIKDKESVIREIDKLDKLSEKGVKENLKKYKAEKLLTIFKKPESFFEKYKFYEEIKELKKYCNYYNIKVNFQPSLARGLSYYNGNVFEITSSGMKETIYGGGSYLVNGIQCTGISCGLGRLSNLAKLDYEDNRLLIIALVENKEVMKIVQGLRKENVSTSLMFGKPSKALQYANSKKIPFVLFIGKEELKSKKFKLKDMEKGKEFTLSLNGIMKKLKWLFYSKWRRICTETI